MDFVKKYILNDFVKTRVFRVDIFMVFAELYKGFLKWPWTKS